MDCKFCNEHIKGNDEVVEVKHGKMTYNNYPRVNRFERVFIYHKNCYMENDAKAKGDEK